MAAKLKEVDNMAEETVVEVADKDVVTLSSGMKVKLHKISQQLSQNTFTRLMKDATLTKDGQLKESDNPVENIKMLAKVDSYYSMLISFGAKLVGTIDDYIKSGVLEDIWLKQLIWAEYDLSNYDLDDQKDKEFLAMRYYGFKDASDWAVLSEKVLNLQQ